MVGHCQDPDTHVLSGSCYTCESLDSKMDDNRMGNLVVI